MLTEKDKRKIEAEEKYRAQVRAEYHIKTNKSRILAVILAIFLGGLGIHKFYLGRAGWGILYFVFSWTGIPMILGFLEGTIYLLTSDKSFNAKYS